MPRRAKRITPFLSMPYTVRFTIAIASAWYNRATLWLLSMRSGNGNPCFFRKAACDSALCPLIPKIAAPFGVQLSRSWQSCFVQPGVSSAG